MIMFGNLTNLQNLTNYEDFRKIGKINCEDFRKNGKINFEETGFIPFR